MELNELPKATGSPAPNVASHLAPFDSFALDSHQEDVWDRLNKRRCFTLNESSIGVDWVDVDKENSATFKKFTSSEEIRQYACQSCKVSPELRVISLHQSYSWSHINATQDVIRSILEATNASAEILQLLSYFYKKSTPVEEAFSNAPFIKHTKSAIETMYILKYVVRRDDENRASSWAIRQTGVYQKYDLISKRSTWIFIHPSKESPFQSRLEQLLKSPEGRFQIREHPIRLHDLLFTTNFPLWRDFMAFHESHILCLTKEIIGNIPEYARVDHKTLTSVHWTENQCLGIQSIFYSTERMLETISKASSVLCEANIIPTQDYRGIVQILDNHSRLLDAYTQNNLLLQKLAARTAQLITDTISLKNSQYAMKNSQYTMDLTMLTVDDSTTMRTITIVTLIYLPSTFMATVLGMNSFFEMDEKSHNLVASRQFWIFVVCAVPLTAVTVLYWLMRKRVQDKERKAKMGSKV